MFYSFNLYNYPRKYYHHFIDEEIWSDRVSDFSKVTEMISGRALKGISVVPTQC